MRKPEWRDPAKEKYWRRLLRQWQRSGLTGRDFCSQQGLSEPSFYAWRHEIARRDQEQEKPSQRATRPQAKATAADLPLPTLVRVAVAAADPKSAALEVVVAGGRRVRVAPGFDAQLLRQLLQVLEEPSC